MTPPATVSEAAQFAVRLGLLSDQTARELLYELEEPTGPPTLLTALMERKGMFTPLQSKKFLAGDEHGYLLGGYRLLYKIASGSFGRVYRGDDPRSGQIVAVKVLRRKHQEDVRRIDSFEREGRLGMSLDHPNIVRILAVGKDQHTGQHYIVMDFVEGGTLRDILQIRKTIEADEALRIMEECAAGLAYAYSRGLTHRDIKPSNILLGTDKVAKLVDFGLAELSQGQEVMIVARKDAKKDEQAERTVEYAGLEKLTNAKSGDVRSDIYFLGHVLFEMIAGVPLLPQAKDRVARGSSRRFQDVDATLDRLSREHHMPPPVVRLIAKAVALEPIQRFQTPALFQEAIKACRAELAGQTGGSGRRAPGQLTVFVVESNPKLQDVFRDKLKEVGFRVLISIDTEQAFKRYQVQPYHALVVDAGTASREGVDVYRRVIKQAANMQLDLGAVLILNDDQLNWKDEADRAGGEVLVRPVTMKQLTMALAKGVPDLTGNGD